jgi:hypothetical protein
MIYSRKREEDILEKRITGFLQGYRHNIAIIGKTRSGKKQLLAGLLRKQFSTSDLVPVYIDLNFVDADALASAAFASLLYAYMHNRHPSCDVIGLDELIVAAEPHIPRTVEKIKSTLAATGYHRHRIDNLFTVIDLFIGETCLKPLCVIDEFTFLKKLHKKTVADLTKYILSQQNCMFIFLSSQRARAEELLNDELNILFGKFEKLILNDLRDSEARHHLGTTLNDRLSQSAQKFLLEITGKNPFYLERFADVLSRLPIDRIDDDIFIDTIAELISDRHSAIYQICWNTLGRLRDNARTAKVVDILRLIADGYTRRKEIASFVHVDTRQLTSRLACLVDENILNRVGSFYCITDRLLAFWISTVLKCRARNGFLHEDDNRRFIAASIRSSFDAMMSVNHKESLERFIELIHRFKDDTVQFNRKAVRLPQIRKSRVVPAHGSNMKFIIGEAKDSYLIMAFKERRAEESDIIEFSNRCSYFRTKQPKKIFVALDGMDSNLKLLAKEKKLICWNRNNINLLMNLYNQPSLI